MTNDHARTPPTGQPAPVSDPALAEIVRRLVDAYEPSALYLFGSAARADAAADSDYDLLVVVPDDAAAARKESTLAYNALRGTGVAADVLVCSRSYFDARLHLEASLPATVVREGVLLHAA
jgi:predicted nucleotidyltransferase